MEHFDLPDIETVEPTDEQEQRERKLLRLDMQRQEEDDERRWKNTHLSRARKCAEERTEYISQRDKWVKWVVGPIHSKKKSKADRERLEAEGE